MGLNDNFYHYLLNINGKNNTNIIADIVKDEKSKLLENVDSVEGFCRYLINQIMVACKQKRIKVLPFDLKKIIGVDHMTLLYTYSENDIIKYILIDPTFEQFCQKEKTISFKFDEWPSEILGKTSKGKKIINDLLINGYTLVDDEAISLYLSSFINRDYYFKLDCVDISVKKL